MLHKSLISNLLPNKYFYLAFEKILAGIYLEN